MSIETSYRAASKFPPEGWSMKDRAWISKFWIKKEMGMTDEILEFKDLPEWLRDRLEILKGEQQKYLDKL